MSRRTIDNNNNLPFWGRSKEKRETYLDQLSDQTSDVDVDSQGTPKNAEANNLLEQILMSQMNEQNNEADLDSGMKIAKQATLMKSSASTGKLQTVSNITTQTSLNDRTNRAGKPPMMNY